MVQVVSRSGDEVTIEVRVPLSGSLLEMEAAILDATNALGRCASEEALGRFDTDGRPIRLGETKLTARGRHPKVSIKARMAKCRSSASSTRARVAGAFTAPWSTRPGLSMVQHRASPAN